MIRITRILLLILWIVGFISTIKFGYSINQFKNFGHVYKDALFFSIPSVLTFTSLYFLSFFNKRFYFVIFSLSILLFSYSILLNFLPVRYDPSGWSGLFDAIGWLIEFSIFIFICICSLLFRFFRSKTKLTVSVNEDKKQNITEKMYYLFSIVIFVYLFLMPLVIYNINTYQDQEALAFCNDLSTQKSTEDALRYLATKKRLYTIRDDHDGKFIFIQRKYKYLPSIRFCYMKLNDDGSFEAITNTHLK